jgi:hypothetical protein
MPSLGSNAFLARSTVRVNTAMTKTGARHRRTLFSLAVLLGLISHLLSAASIQAQVLSDPRIAEFDPSPDHWAVLGSGQPAVLRYDLDIYVVGSATSFATLSMGRPDPEADGKIRYDFSSALASISFPGGNYEARVSAVGPEGEALSEPSNPFTFGSSSGCTYALNTTTVRAVAAGGDYSAVISTGQTCGWTASTSLSWVTLYATSGTGSVTVPFQVQQNTSTFGRTGVVTIGGQSLTVAQDAVAPTKTTPTVTWPTPAPIAQGTPLGQTQLNAVASVPGTFAYNPAAGTILSAGTHTLKTTFTPADSSAYNTATAHVTLVVNPPRTSPVITWPAPASITEGTALSSTQLNAAANVPGTFAYNPAAGTLLAAGTYTLGTTFTPTDTTLYTTARASVSLTVALPPTTSSGPSEPPSNSSDLPSGPPYTLTVELPAGGFVKAPPYIKCGTNGSACTVTVPGPMTITLQAKADRGYVFTGWAGHCLETSANYTLALEGARTCRATFVRTK